VRSLQAFNHDGSMTETATPHPEASAKGSGNMMVPTPISPRIGSSATPVQGHSLRLPRLPKTSAWSPMVT
jgi:hypothetical protein